MNTKLLKKGRSAVAIILSLALILTTATFPVAIAKADTIPVTISEKVEAPYTDSDPTAAGIQYVLPDGTNYLFIKQGSSQNVLWSATTLTTDQLNAIKAQLTGKAESLDDAWTLIVGYDVHTITPLHGSTYTYGFSLNPDGTVIFTFDSSKVSHFFYGHVGTPEYEITVTKAVTLNGEASNPLLDTTFYVALYDANGKVAGTLEQPIVIENGIVKNTVTFKVTDKTKTYYIYETDGNGTILTPGIDIEGYYLQSITNQGNSITVSSTTVPATLTITNNLVDREPDTIPVEIQKNLVGMDLTAGQFSFTLVETDSDWDVLDITKADVKTNDATGKVVFDDLVFDEVADGEETRYFIIYENIPDTSDAEYMYGMLYDTHAIHLTINVSEEGDAIVAEVESMTGSATFTNTMQYGQISVTKAVVFTGKTLPEDGINGTFYAGLFTMVDDEYVLVKFGDEKAIAELVVVNSAPVTDSTTFVGLDLNETYYVFETDVNGVIIPTDGTDNGSGNILPLTTVGWYALAYAGTEITLTPRNLTDEATITNYFNDFEAPFDPSIKVIKTVTVNNKPTASNLTFYAGLFEDPELTKLVAFKPLPMNGTTTAEASFAFYQDGVTPLKVGTTYYVAETDKDGKPLAGTAKELGFEITINGVTNNNSTVVLIEEEAVVNIVNNFKKEEFPLTGDNSNMNLWLFLAMLGVAGAIAPFAFRKKEVAND